MAVKIKLQRLGKIRTPEYRVVVQDARTKRSGKIIENLGIYQPTQEPSLIQIDSERAQYWLGVGAQPTEPVLALLKITGDWQKHKGIEGAEGTLKTKVAKEEYVAPSKGSVVVEKSEAPAEQAEEAPAEEAASEEAAEEKAE